MFQTTARRPRRPAAPSQFDPRHEPMQARAIIAVLVGGFVGWFAVLGIAKLFGLPI